MLVRDRLFAVGLEKGLRQSTIFSYERLLRGLGILDEDFTQVTHELVMQRLWELDNPNTRRASVIAIRSVFGFSIKIPKSVPRRYDLPDEDTLKLALMTSPHEARGLLMMYAGLRIGEACAITHKDVAGDRLSVDKQVQVLHRTGHPTITRIGPVKSSEATVVIPWHLVPTINSLDATAKPDVVRESLRRAGRKCGFNLNPHLLRHWYATTMLKRGIPLSLVSQQMRHSDISVTLRTYSQHDDSAIHDAFG